MSAGDNHTGYYVMNYENSSSEALLFGFDVKVNDFIKLISRHYGSKDTSNSIHKIKTIIPPKSDKTIIFEIVDLYKASFSVFNNYDISIARNFLPKDSNASLVAKHIDFPEREVIFNGSDYLELKLGSKIFLVFHNLDVNGLKIKFNFKTLSNLNINYPINSNNLIVEPNAFSYIELSIDNKNDAFNYVFEYNFSK